MKKSFCTAAVLFSCIFFFWPVIVWGGDYVLGEAIYQGSCERCHGSNGDGNGPDAATMSPKPPDFNDPKFWRMFNEKKMTDVVRKGRGQMPAFEMSSEEIHVIINYMTLMFKPAK